MDRFWDLLERSTLISGIIALAMVGTASYCVITETPFPDYFALPLGVIIGYFFSEKVRGVRNHRIKAEGVDA